MCQVESQHQNNDGMVSSARAMMNGFYGNCLDILMSTFCLSRSVDAGRRRRLVTLHDNSRPPGYDGIFRLEINVLAPGLGEK